MPEEKSFRRFDCQIEFSPIEGEEGSFNFILRPNPDRYEWVDRDGRRYLYDRFDDALLPESILEQMVKELPGKLSMPQEAQISDSRTYVNSRIGPIQEVLRNRHLVYYGPSNPSEDVLQNIGPRQHEFVFMSVDVKGSTDRWLSAVSENDTADIVTILQSELFTIVPLFKGNILNPTGDGFMAYFPAPSFITMHDLALDCALTMLRLVEEALNPCLQEVGFEPIVIRIGLESGRAQVRAVGSPTAGQKMDILGMVPSIASKIQSNAPPGGIGIGEVVERNLHASWRKQIDRESQLQLPYTHSDTGEPYIMYRVIPTFS